jgi:hypothetical protein
MAFVIEGGEDPSGQVGRAAAVDQLEQLVQIDLLLGRDTRRELARESGLHEPSGSPLHQAGLLRGPVA